MDLLLVERGLAESRERAKRLIMAGLVEVDGIRRDKPGLAADPFSTIRIKDPRPPFVSRGGLKLDAALDAFSVDVQGLTLLDVGASTGGFTDCLLKRGAARVIAVDVGRGQLHWELRQDPRVRVMERTNARYLAPEDLAETVQGAVIDVSFISLRLIVPPVSACLGKGAFIMALIKPQFEVGREKVGKGGVVRDDALRRQVIEDLGGFFRESGWDGVGHIPSPILGPKGNQEYLMYLRRRA